MSVVELAPASFVDRLAAEDLERECRAQRELIRALQEQLADQRRQLILHLEDRAQTRPEAAGAGGGDLLLPRLFSRRGPGGKPAQYYLYGEQRAWWRIALLRPFNVTRWSILRRVQRRRRRRGQA